MPNQKNPSFFSSNPIIKCIILAIIFIFVFSLIPNINCAVGSETTAYLEGFTKNQNMNVLIGNYSIFATDRKIFFYDISTAILIKTWALPEPSSFSDVTRIRVRITAINSTFISVVTSWVFSPSPIDQFFIRIYWLNVNNLAYILKITYTYDEGNNYSYPQNYDSVIWNSTNGNIYAVIGVGVPFLITDIPNRNYFYRIYPTTASLGYTDIANTKLTNPSLVIPSKTSTDECYVLTNSTITDTKARLIKLSITTPTATYLGETSFGNSFSTKYVYLVDWIYHDVSGTFFYDVLVVFNDDASTQTGGAVVIRFNNSYLNEGIALKYIELYNGGEGGAILTPYYTSLSDIVRFMSVSLPVDSYGNGTLQNGYYRMLYATETASKLAVFKIQIVNLTQTSNWNIVKIVNGGESPIYYPTFISPQPFYFSSSSNTGGLAYPFSSVIIYLDYQNNKIISDIISSLNINFNFIYSVTPSPIDCGVNFIDAYLSQTYLYTGYIYFNGIQNGNGTFIIYSTGLGLSPTITSLGSYTQVGNGIISKGKFMFYISARITTYNTVYEGLKVEIVLNYTTTQRIYLMTWTLNPEIPNPNEPQGYGGFDLTWFMIIFLCVFLPPMALGLSLGIAGFVGGLTLTLGISIATGLLPMWILIFVGVAFFIIFLIWRR